MKKFVIEKGETNTILRTISSPVGKHEFVKYKKITQEMLRYIKNPKHLGVGLAAPQIGINKRIIVVSLMESYEDEDYRTIELINPEILSHSQEILSDSEGCLSLPGVTGVVSRFKALSVAFFDSKGLRHVLNLTGLPARIVQHEIDHINGVLFIDRIKEQGGKIKTAHTPL